MANGGSTVVEYCTHFPKIKGSNPTEERKWRGKDNIGLSYRPRQEYRIRKLFVMLNI
jgi:hypothetical protein